MEINADPITLDEAEARAFTRQLAVAQQREPDLTADKLATRLLRKLVRGWAAAEAERFARETQPIIQDVVRALATDPDRDAKLAPFGLRFAAGTLERVPLDAPGK